MSKSFSIAISLKCRDSVVYYMGCVDRFIYSWSNNISDAFRYECLREVLLVVDSLVAELSHPDGYTVFPLPFRDSFTVFKGYRLELVPLAQAPSPLPQRSV